MFWDFPGGPDSELPMQGAQVRSLVRELDPSYMLQLRSLHATTKKSMPQLKDPACRNEDPSCGN